MKSATTNIYFCLLSAVVIVVNDFLFELQIECCCLLYLHCNLWDLCDASCALDGAKVCAWSDYCMTCVLGSEHQQYQQCWIMLYVKSEILPSTKCFIFSCSFLYRESLMWSTIAKSNCKIVVSWLSLSRAIRCTIIGE